jgi:hypothetical protein
MLNMGLQEVMHSLPPLTLHLVVPTCAPVLQVLSEFTRSPKALELARKKGGWQAGEETEADRRLPRIPITKYIMLQV